MRHRSGSIDVIGWIYPGHMADNVPVIVAVEVPAVGDERRKNWAKIVTNVDTSQSSGWAFEGDFIATGGIQDVPAGSVVLVYGERGSKANAIVEAKVYRANADGTMSFEAGSSGRAWARTLRDKVEELVTSDPIAAELDWSPDLSRYSDAAITEEYRRRKLDAVD